MGFQVSFLVLFNTCITVYSHRACGWIAYWYLPGIPHPVVATPPTHTLHRASKRDLLILISVYKKVVRRSDELPSLFERWVRSSSWYHMDMLRWQCASLLVCNYVRWAFNFKVRRGAALAHSQAFWSTTNPVFQSEHRSLPAVHSEFRFESEYRYLLMVHSRYNAFWWSSDRPYLFSQQSARFKSHSDIEIMLHRYIISLNPAKVLCSAYTRMLLL